MDECKDKENPACDQLCTNEVGSFRCACNEGYYLSMDNRTCLVDLSKCTTGSSYWYYSTNIIVLILYIYYFYVGGMPTSAAKNRWIYDAVCCIKCVFVVGSVALHIQQWNFIHSQSLILKIKQILVKFNKKINCFQLFTHVYSSPTDMR